MWGASRLKHGTAEGTGKETQTLSAVATSLLRLARADLQLATMSLCASLLSSNTQHDYKLSFTNAHKTHRERVQWQTKSSIGIPIASVQTARMEHFTGSKCRDFFFSVKDGCEDSV